MRILKLTALVGVALLALAMPATAQSDFVRGDCNVDGNIDVSDPIFYLTVLFSAGGPVLCEDSCDANDDGGNDIGDAIYVLGFLFGGSSPPAAPNPSCGADPTADALTCASFSLCVPLVEDCTNAVDDDADGDVDCADSDCVGDPACVVAVAFAAIQPIFDAACTVCHGGPMPFAGLSLETTGTSDAYANIVNVQATECLPVDFIEPGDPTLSWLFRKVMDTHTDADIVNLGCSGPSVGSQMPIGAFCCLTPAEVDLLEQWIIDGAQP